MRDLELIRSYRSDVESDDEARERARATLRAHIASPRRRLRKRRLGWTLGLLLVVTSGATAARIVLTSDDIPLASVACLDAERTMRDLGRSVFVDATGDPVGACARVWREGHFGNPPGQVPDLVACVSRGRPVEVMPGDSGTCAKRGLEPLPDDYAESAAALGKAWRILMRDADLRPRTPCDDPATVLRHARQLLEDASVEGVDVELAGSGPCAGWPNTEGGRIVRLETMSRERSAKAYETRIREG